MPTFYPRAKELVSIDHRKAREDASVVRQSVGLLEAEMKLIKVGGKGFGFWVGPGGGLEVCQ